MFGLAIGCLLINEKGSYVSADVGRGCVCMCLCVCVCVCVWRLGGSEEQINYFTFKGFRLHSNEQMNTCNYHAF